MNITARPRDAGDISLEDPRDDIALSTGNGPPHEKCPSFSAQHVARTTTSRMVRSQTLRT
eukprot:12522019-Prorocentrum_lima.AAC.1